MCSPTSPSALVFNDPITQYRHAVTSVFNDPITQYRHAVTSVFNDLITQYQACSDFSIQ